MKTEIELFENALDTTSVNGKKLREYINENYISNSVLDKIRAEINTMPCAITSMREIYVNRDKVISIINKYKAEKE